MKTTNILGDISIHLPGDFISLWPDRFIIAVSGGRDSMFLLYLVIELVQRYGLSKPIVCYINHQIRKEAQLDQEAIELVTSLHGLEFTVIKANVPLLSQKMGMSLEETGRWVRYSKLSKLASLTDCVVCTAHHSNDYFESLLMHLIRGGGKSSLTTMPLFKKMGNRLTLFRPLLFLARQTIDDMVIKFKIPYVEDLSNSTTDFLRNRIRHNVMQPLLNEGLNTPKIWKNFHQYDRLSLPTSLELVDVDYVCIDRNSFNHSLYTLSTLKDLLDPYLKVLGLFPTNKKFLVEIQNQVKRKNSCHINLYLENKLFTLTSSDYGSVWIFKNTSQCFKNPYVKRLEEFENKSQIEIAYNHIKKTYRIDKNIEVTSFKDGMRFLFKDNKRKKIKKIFQEQKVPEIVRKKIPVFWNKDREIVVRICLSFWQEGKDFVC